MVTWHLTMKLCPAKCHERATLRKLWRQTGNSSLLPAKCVPLLHVTAGISARFSNFPFVLFCSNLNVSLDFISGNIEILGKQNSLFPAGPPIKCFKNVLLARALQWEWVVPRALIRRLWRDIWFWVFYRRSDLHEPRKQKWKVWQQVVL